MNNQFGGAPCFSRADILLPDFSRVDGTRWAVIACDQFTSEPDYWEAVDKTVGTAPSTRHLMIPEIYLNSDRADTADAINRRMSDYLGTVLTVHPGAMIYLRRTCSDGRVRAGLIGKIDLETYSYMPADRPLIRATEGTVLSRIPPRVEVRRHAPAELPHVMLLADDPEDKLLGPLAAMTETMKPAYDFPLMMGGGAVCGWFLPETEIVRIEEEIQRRQISRDGQAPFTLAVGDGNHSLAAAKAYYEELKKTMSPEAAAVHPARYALAEMVNIRDTALTFEPIYRVVFGTDAAFLTRLRAFAAQIGSDTRNAEYPTQTVHCVSAAGECEVVFTHGVHTLTVGTLQTFLDRELERHPGMTVDYIHGEASLRALAAKEGAVGFLFSGMRKDELFPAVSCDGPLPRKTFSMGEARDKRYYLEVRGIR